MYIRKQHQLTDLEAIFSLIENHALGAWVCTVDGVLEANHIPFFLDRSQGASGTLIGHVSRANPVWRALEAGLPSVVLFQGPQSYISPGWYPGKTEHGKVVPTWNYVVAHVHGVARARQEPDWLRGMLQRLAQVHEGPQPVPWRLDDAPADYIDKMLRAIVGIEIPIDRLVGKLKASQDEDMQDRLGTVAGLAQSPGDEAQAMAALVRQAIDKESGQG
ncbi:MAG: FMN-binding negative transcriptional regulator [Rhodoferax sp.]|nr:MAG: FMN-binding negative transcriptional regulator [Rhodoferax sp.]